MASRLNVLMKMFNISGKDLSRIMHIDDSLISKWRSGKRTLKPKSSYAEKVVGYIMDLDKSNNYANVCKLLADKYDNIFSCSKNEIEIFLKTWLTGDNDYEEQESRLDLLKEMDNVEISMQYTFKGNEGRRQAVKFLDDYALNCSDDIELISFTTEEASWFYDDKEYMKNWVDENLEILKHGCRLKIIHPVNRSYENMAISILRWMPLHMTGKTEAYYIPKYTPETINYTYFLIPGHIALTGSYANDYSKNIYTSITNEPAVLERVSDIIKQYTKRALRLFKRYYCQTDSGYIKNLSEILNSQKMRYLHSTLFIYYPMSDELIYEILEYNGFLPEKIKEFIDVLNKIYAEYTRGQNRYLINMDILKEELENDEVVLDCLSFITGIKVRVSKELFRKRLAEVLVSLNDMAHVEVGMISRNIFDSYGRINVLAEANTYVQFMRADIEEPLLLSVEELTMVVSIFDYSEMMWNAIPDRERNKDFVSGKIQELLNETGKA